MNVLFLLDRLYELPKEPRTLWVNGKRCRLMPGIMTVREFRKKFRIPKHHEIVRVWRGYEGIPQEITIRCGYVEHGGQGRCKDEFFSRPRPR